LFACRVMVVASDLLTLRWLAYATMRCHGNMTVFSHQYHEEGGG
jgi:hypothetical protein